MEQNLIHPASITDGEAGFITRVEELAYELKIAEVMTREIKTVSPATKMADVLELFRIGRISGAPVIDNGQLVGIISIEDLIKALRDLGRSELKVSVADYMTRNVITIHGFDPLIEALKLFTKTHLGRLPVLDEAGQMVGIISKGDVTRGLLNALQHDYQHEEVRRYRASHLFEDIDSNRTSLILRYHIEHGDFTHGGTASSKIKQALLRLGADAQTARRCGIAIYEAEMNLVIHTWHGGEIWVEVEPSQIVMETFDDGPGIADINLVMQPGSTPTASEAVREMGFGAGMGLVNIKRCVDEMNLEFTPGKSTRLTMKIRLQAEQTLREIKKKGKPGEWSTMTLQEIIKALNLTVLAGAKDFSQVTPTSGYTSDLLSCVMAGAKNQGVWVTLQAHMNVVAVAALLEVSAVIITEGAQPEPDVLAKAETEGITLLSTDQPSFYVVGKLWEMGLRVE